ncbi:MAG: hypothetical protein Q4D19_11705 [Lautropia sp.]|nr:hypothetical protein [Lautropia sp.]
MPASARGAVPPATASGWHRVPRGRATPRTPFGAARFTQLLKPPLN